MAISEAGRSDLYTGLRDVLGPDRAETLMSAIPLHDFDEVATKGDLAELRAELRADIAELGSQLRNEMSELRVEMRKLRVEMTGDADAFRRNMTGWLLMLAVANIAAVASVAWIT